MKIKNYDLKSFSDFGTLVFYPPRNFSPEVKENFDLSQESELGFASYYKYSTNLLSDLVDFAKYNFDFNTNENSILANQFDLENTINNFGLRFDSYANKLTPQLIERPEEQDNLFFGKMVDSDRTIYLLRIKNIWKIEVYNDRLVSNNIYSDFIEYDLLKENEATSKPVFTICFGPEYDTRIIDYTFDDVLGFSEYIKKYCDLSYHNFLSEEIYNNFENKLSKSEYIKQYKKEVESDKIVYLVTTNKGEITTLDIFSPSFLNSDEKYRNQNKNILRQDEESPKTPFELSDTIKLDKRSNTILGINNSDCPIFKSRYNRLKNEDIYSRSSNMNKVTISGKTFIHPKEQVIFGENPDISPYWILENSNNPLFSKHYILLGSGKGNINPYGEIVKRKDKDIELNITPEIGFEYLNIEGATEIVNKDNKYILKNPEDIVYINFREKLYKIDIILQDSTKVPILNFPIYNSETKDNFALVYYNYDSENFVIFDEEELISSKSEPFIFNIISKNPKYKIKNFYYLNNPEKHLTETESEFYIVDEIVPSKSGSNESIILLGVLEINKFTVNIELISGEKQIQISTDLVNTFEYGDNFSFRAYSETNQNLDIIIKDSDNQNIDVTDSWNITCEDGIYTIETTGISKNYKIEIR